MGEWRNWQTRRIQVPVSERMWGFKSPLAHTTPTTPRALGNVAMSDPRHGELSYLQIPASDIEKSATFYREVFGWAFNPGFAPAFDAAGLHGMLDTNMAAAESGGPVLWLFVADINTAVLTVACIRGGLLVGVR